MVDIIISLTEEEVISLNELATEQNFKTKEDYIKFKTLQDIKIRKFDKDITTERAKFEKTAEQTE